jgi:hypothetical protein
MICYPDQLELLLTFALNSNAIGPDYFYLFPGQDVYSLERNLRIMDGKFVTYRFLLFLECSSLIFYVHCNDTVQTHLLIERFKALA